MARHAARFKISAQVLIQALAMPEGTSIYNIKRDDYWPDTFEFIVEHPDLPEIVEGGYPKQIDPSIKIEPDKTPETWVTFDWGVR